MHERIGPDSLRLLVDHSPDGVLVVDASGTVCFANAAAEATFSPRAGSRLVGQPFGIPLVAADKTDIDVPRPDGSIEVYELRVSSTSWDDHEATLVTLRDVTERVRHEAHVVELNRELQLRAQAAKALHHVGDGVLLLDELDIVRYWNPAAERILGVPAGRAVGRAVGDVIQGWPQVKRDVTVASARLDEQPEARSVTLQVDGQEAWLSITGVQFDGGTVYAFHDMTEEMRVARLKKDFIDTASHELRTPLTSIYGAARTLQRRDLELDPKMHDQLIEVICVQAERLHGITEDILTTRRLDEEGPAVELATFDAGSLAADALVAVEPQAPPGIVLEMEDRLNGSRTLCSDEGKLRQVLTNLVQNAVKYSPHGGAVRVSVVSVDDGIQFGVHDQGLGIARKDLDQIFDKFYRAEAGPEHRISGTGLGLYIARELVRRLGGDLWAVSRPNAGSSFFVRLPIEPGAHVAHPR